MQRIEWLGEEGLVLDERSWEMSLKPQQPSRLGCAGGSKFIPLPGGANFFRKKNQNNKSIKVNIYTNIYIFE